MRWLLLVNPTVKARSVKRSATGTSSSKPCGAGEVKTSID
jgi:hypothetical protein